MGEADRLVRLRPESCQPAIDSSIILWPSRVLSHELAAWKTVQNRHIIAGTSMTKYGEQFLVLVLSKNAYLIRYSKCLKATLLFIALGDEVSHFYNLLRPIARLRGKLELGWFLSQIN